MEYYKIERLREKNKINKSDLCRLADISPMTYRRIINGKTIPMVNTLEAISKVLGVEPSYWWQKDAEKENILNESSIEYSKNCSNCKRLIKQIKQQQDHIDLLMEECNRKKNTSVG